MNNTCCLICKYFKGHGNNCIDQDTSACRANDCDTCKICYNWKDKTAEKPIEECNPIDNKFTHDLLHAAQEVRDLVLLQEDQRVSQSMTFKNFAQAIQAIEDEQAKKWAFKG